MYEIAEPAPDAPFPAIQPATRFSEIGDGREFAVDWSCGVPARVEGVAGFLGGVFVFEARVDIADEIYLGESHTHHVSAPVPPYTPFPTPTTQF